MWVKKHLLLPIVLFLLPLSPLTRGDGPIVNDPGSRPPTYDSAYDTIIIGGGIAGLSCAYYLKNKSILLLEKENRVGGRAVSGTYEGFTYAQGTEYLGEPEDYLARIIEELNLNAVEIPEPMDARYYDGKLYIGYGELEEMLVEYSSRSEYNRFVRLLLQLYNSGYDDVPYFDLNSSLAPLDTMTAKEWFIQNNFSSLYREVYNVASRGLFGASMEEISALSYLPELAFEFIDADLSPTGNPRPKAHAARAAEEGSGSYSFVTGITEVTAAIAGRLGNNIRLKAEVKEVSLQNGLYSVYYEDSNQQGVTLYAKTVVLAVPAPVALQIAPGVLSSEQKQIMGQVNYSPYITVNLFSDEPIFNSAFDLAVPDNLFFTDVYDSTWVQRAYDSSLTGKKKYIIAIYIAAQSYKDQTLLQLSDNQVLSNIYSQLDNILPGAQQKVTGYDIRRFSYAYPVMSKGAYTRLTRLHQITTGNVQLAGDYMSYPTFEAAVETGHIAGEKILDRLRDTFTDPTVSGTVTHKGTPLKNTVITFSFNGHTEKTGGSGTYSYTVPYGTTTDVTPSKGGYGFNPAKYSLSLLTGDRSVRDFTAGDSVLTITSHNDGETVSGTEIVSAVPSVSGITRVEFYIDGSLVKTDSRAPYQYRWETSKISNGTHTLKAAAFNSGGQAGSHQVTVTVANSTAAPHILFNRDRLNFTTIINGTGTGSQTVTILNGGGGTLSWTAAGSAGWLTLSPAGGSAGTPITVGANGPGLAAGTYNGSILVTCADASNSPASLPVVLTVKAPNLEQPPSGLMATPVNGAVVNGSVPVTGWVLDDTQVSSVKIYRNPVPGETGGRIFIGDALFIDGARTDIEALYPDYPNNYKAGWGYMMLSNFLPNGGNGDFTITAIAADNSGNSTVLGTHAVTVNNAGSVSPFGAIDFPAQGGDASGSEYTNMGWVLTPPPNTIPTDGSTITLWVDSIPLKNSARYNQSRPDVAALFPGYNNSAAAGANFYLDTTLYGNGVHSIAWTVSDNRGNSAGVGSRFFTILNLENSTSLSTPPRGRRLSPPKTASRLPIYFKKGHHHRLEFQAIRPGKRGGPTISIKEGQYIQVRFRSPRRKWKHKTAPGYRYSGYLSRGETIRPLPPGSTLDETGGIFHWRPAPGFLGPYPMVFLETDPRGSTRRIDLTVSISPKF